ncbi:MAG TPA: FlgD immunoglobulin-like domain containing protein [Longimicrobium sp.]|jgi:YD repeat-containing protein
MSALARRAALGALAALGASLAPAAARPAAAQTFLATRAIDERICSSFLGISSCRDVETDRVHQTFTQNKLGTPMFAETWATATHCTSVDSEQECQRSVSVGSDPKWNRLIWGRSNSFVHGYGSYGAGVGQFNGPRGVDITRSDGEWHVAFVADAYNNRVVVLGLGSSCQCVRWLGTLDGAESGIRLSSPHDVAWDPAVTWSMADDRLFIADTGNDRIVVYQVGLNPAGGTMSKSYLGSFGASGAGSGQMSEPRGIAVRSFSSLYADVYVSDTGNRRVSLWYYDTSVSSVPASSPYPARNSAPIDGAELQGISRDAYGDLVVADRGRDVLVKLSSYSLSPLEEYGQGWTWSVGSFNDPTDTEVVYRYTSDSYGQIVSRGLPYAQTTERWSPSTGGQMHRLGASVRNLAAAVNEAASPKDATFSFLFTGTGSYRVLLKRGSTVVRDFGETYVSAGWMSVYWNGREANGTVSPAGTYTVQVQHRSGYTYDDSDPPLVAQTSFAFGFLVSAQAPGYVSSAGTHYLYGSASSDATAWVWERMDTYYNSGYSSGWFDWDYQQNSSATIYPLSGEDMGIDWRVSATRTSSGERASGYASTYVAGTYGGYCDIPPCVVEPMLREGPADSARTVSVPVRGKVVLGVLDPLRGPGAAPEQPTREGGHFGAGAWIGRATARGPQVVQLYSLAGKHEARGGGWPNALAGRQGEAVQENERRPGRIGARAAFRRLDAGGEGRESYAVRLQARAPAGGAALLEKDGAAGGALAGLALDPDLGAVPHDDRLGVDAQTGLVWVADPDSGAVGYVLTDLPQGARASVRQFSTERQTRWLDPPSDSAAYAELAAGEDRLTGRPGDVRFVIALSGLALEREAVVGLVVLRARSLDELREQAARVPRTGMVSAAAASRRSGIDRFRLAQAPPEPGAGPGVRSISPSEVPALLSREGAEAAPAAPALRDLVRRHGITALAFAVPDGEPVRVQVKVYDARGRLVRRLVDETHEPGAYRVQWDGADERGAKAAPGVYVAVMEAPGFRATTRLVVVP